jgi:hypothetical protein
MLKGCPVDPTTANNVSNGILNNNNPIILPYKRIVKCLVEVQGENGMKKCGHIMGTDSSTENSFCTWLINMI